MTQSHTESPPKKLPLEGVRVLELGVLLAGPYAGRLLAEFGAEVIKVEAPNAGDPLRDWGQHRHNGRSLWWPVQSRNKKLISLNLREAEGQEMCRKLAAECDVLIENFRPGTLEKWGLGPEDLKKINPGLIYARVSGYGQTGPYSDRPGFASVGEAMGGIRYINGYPGQAPPRAGISLGDSLAAIYATIGILVALRHRDVGGGSGQVVDASIAESCYALLESMVPDFGLAGAIREPSGTALDHVAPSNLYKSKEGKWVVIAANTTPMWLRLCQAIDRPDLLEDERFASHYLRGKNREILDQIIGQWTSEHSNAELDKLLTKAGIAFGPVNTIEDIYNDPHFRARDMIIEMQDPEIGPIPAPGIIPKLSDSPGQALYTGGWHIGQDNQEVMGKYLGLSPQDIDDLTAREII